MSNIDFIKKAARLARANVGVAVKEAGYPKLKEAVRKLDIKLGKKVAEGANTAIYLNNKLEKIYCRKNLCLKVFRYDDAFWGRGFAEGEGPILESTKVQNLMALIGLAPRVYEVVEVKGKIAQVCDYLEGDLYAVPISDGRFEFNKKEIKMSYNFIDGKLVDFQAAVFVDYEGYRAKVLKEAQELTQWPWGGRGLYQSLSYCDGKRNTQERLKMLQFRDFKDKNVLDIGCNIGVFCREACRLGARRVVGLDIPKIVKIASELAILDGYFNIDFYGVDLKKMTGKKLKKLTGIDKFDIHLYLAMEDYLDWPDWVKNCKTLYYEGHGQVRPYKVFQYE